LIVLDTHTWIWWVHADPRLPPAIEKRIRATSANERMVSMISCWEVAKLIEHRRLTLPVAISTWLEQASQPSVAQMVPLTLPIIVDATSLPAGFHKDPVDQIIVATARILGAVLLTVDDKILNYDHVRTFSG
jgi:PIN domain nuclease of toxin-antitoxin system